MNYYLYLDNFQWTNNVYAGSCGHNVFLKEGFLSYLYPPQLYSDKENKTIAPDIWPFLISGIRPDIQFRLLDIRMLKLKTEDK